MEISPRKPSKRSQEPVDEWLQTEGYFRKHAPKDPTCLFRAVSEQVYMTQYYHIKVRKECVEFMRKMKHLFIENVIIPFDDYLEQMECFTEWGGINEIQAMSLLYQREFIIYNGQKQISYNVTNNGFQDTIYLCHTPQKQYESIYTRDFVATAAYCQSIVYQVLYKNVFHMSDIEDTVHKMLHDRSGTFRHDKFFLKGNLEIREELTTEIFTKVETETYTDEVDNGQAIPKNIPPFPYRIAKALDPNIYRNTDFDIWHEIRREVKNAGWTRHNSHELQVGGKCLVQMDFNENDIDEANNNSVYMSSLEKESNDNNVKTVEKKDKQGPAFFYGHIQEMSKDQGPVLVFIEELGEKKIVPYSALKPLPLRKNKQNNWLPTYKRNVLLDSNQKWKKNCGSGSRKIKESTSMNIFSNNIDKHENSDNSVNDINKNNFQWKEESLKVAQHGYENYTMEKCTNFPINNSVPQRNIFDNTQSSTVEPVRQENNKQRKERTSFTNKNSENNVIKNVKPDGINNNNKVVNTGFNLYSKQRVQKEAHYSSYSEDPSNQMLRPINCSVQKSVDINGSDLPLSDPFTLRFFYNLGLEYFRGSTNWNYLTNGQTPDFGQWYQGIPQNDMGIENITNGVLHDCRLTEKNNNDQKETNTPQLMCNNNTRVTQTLQVEGFKGEHGKDLHPSHDKIKEHEPFNKSTSYMNRSGLGPRFKKNTDNRSRFNQHSTPPTNQYLSNESPNFKPPPPPPKLEMEMKGDDGNVQHSMIVPPQLQTPTNTMNSYQVPYMQQGMYPYYANEAEGFANSYYTPNTGYFPMPYLPPSEIPDNNNIQSFSPQLYPGIDYAQAYSGLCPPYVCPQPPPYAIPPQNMQEHWYAVAGQPHYMQYTPVLPVTTEATCNGISQSASQNVSL
ncbi:uncharacterized protein LOC114873365 isoform X1 [Osmia bicornis bicornis]|uniref:uncharacterized protein LOC114873365 isoform X1 n=1 Tax=Osmia bicornis bicornis TaxID=1437191 RepID=UPI001EAEE86C|nr:uncharacterized protein LOC114873365 isoform X1 [Osmia bicornis bicornis]